MIIDPQHVCDSLIAAAQREKAALVRQHGNTASIPGRVTAIYRGEQRHVPLRESDDIGSSVHETVGRLQSLGIVLFDALAITVELTLNRSAFTEHMSSANKRNSAWSYSSSGTADGIFTFVVTLDDRRARRFVEIDCDEQGELVARDAPDSDRILLDYLALHLGMPLFGYRDWVRNCLAEPEGSIVIRTVNAMIRQTGSYAAAIKKIGKFLASPDN